MAADRVAVNREIKQLVRAIRLEPARLPRAHHRGTRMVMATAKRSRAAQAAVARTIRFPRRLRESIAADAERCGRSFEAHVIALLRKHFGEDVDIAPAPRAILALARGSFAGLSAADQKLVAARLVENDRR